jgi:hypothetical protein
MVSRRGPSRWQPLLLFLSVGALGLFASSLLFEVSRFAPRGDGSAASAGTGSASGDVAHAASAGADAHGAGGEATRTDDGPARDAEAAVPPPAEPLSGPTTTYFGRVVDERRFPVADAQLTLWLPDRPAVDAKSDADGRFEIATAAITTQGSVVGGVHARDGKGRAALAPVWMWINADSDDFGADQARRDVGTIVLEPAGRVVADLRDDDGSVAGAALMMEVGEERRLALTATTDAGGRARFEDVPAGDVVVHALVPGRGVARATARVEAGGAAELSLRVAPVPPVEVTVKSKESGALVPDTRVVLMEMVPSKNAGGGSYKERGNTFRDYWRSFPPTDEAGVTRLDGVELEGTFQIAVRPAAGYFPSWDDHCPGQLDLRSGRKVTLWVSKPEPKCVRFPAAAGSAPVPADGTLLAFAQGQRDWFGQPIAATVTLDHGEVVVESPWPWDFFAWVTAPDGAIAELRTQSDENEQRVGLAARFEAPRRVVVTLADPDGNPCMRHRVSLKHQTASFQGMRDRVKRTDDEGRVEFTDLLPGRADLHAALDRDAWPDYALGVLDLANGDGRLDAQLPGVRELLLAVRIDGEARLPTRFQVSAERLIKSRTEEDPAKGELHLFVLEDGAGRTRTVSFTADDFPPQTIPVPPAQPDAPTRLPTRLEVELSTGGTLVVRTVAAPQAWPRLKLDRYDAAQDTFGDFPGMPGWIGAPNGPDGSYVFTSLAPGLYRAVDRRSGVASEPVEVFGGGRRSEVELDVKHVVIATGRVVAPAGMPVWMARVVVDDGVQPTEPYLKSGNVNTPGFGVQRDGAFRVVLPLKRAARLHAWHPWLRPSQQGGDVEVSESVDGLELALEEAPSLQFQPAGEQPLGDGTWLRVWLADSARRDQVAAARFAVLQGGVARFGQVPTGVFDLVIDAGFGAPVFRRNVELDASGGDLGRVPIPRGSQLTLELDVPDGIEKPKTYAFARRLGPVSYARGSSGVQETAPVIPGLGAGRFDVTLCRESGDTGWRGEVEIDGVNDLTLHVAVR